MSLVDQAASFASNFSQVFSRDRADSTTYVFSTTYDYVSNASIPKSRTDYEWREKGRGLWSHISKIPLQFPSAVQLALTILHLLNELFIGIMYIEVQTHDQTELSFTEHDDDVNYFYIKNVLSVYFAVMWVTHCGVISQFWSKYTLITFITCGWQIVYAIVGTRREGMDGYYVPIFLRCWVFKDYLLHLFNFIETSKGLQNLYRNLFFSILNVLCVMYTCMGFYRIVETFQGHIITLNETFYFMVVTFTTVGYGDITPESRWGQFVVICVIFVATAVLPVFLATLQEGAEVIENSNEYSAPLRHIIVTGSPTYKETRSFLEEVMCYSAQRAVVFVSRKPFTERILALTNEPLFRNRVVFIEGEISSRSVADRAKLKKADAIVILSDKHAVSCRGDYTAMKHSVAVRKMDPKLPQYLWLKYGTHDFILDSVFAAVHRERLKKTIAGVALVHPGIIPFLVNLVRSHNPPMTPALHSAYDEGNSEDWQSLYTLSRANETFPMQIPWELQGLTFEKAALVLHKNFRIMPLGVADCKTTALSINPQGMELDNAEHVLLVMAQNSESVRAAEEEMQKNQVIEVNDDGTYHRGDGYGSPHDSPVNEDVNDGESVSSPTLIMSNDPNLTVEDVEHEANHSFVKSLAAPFRAVQNLDKNIGEELLEDALDKQAADHFLLVDQNTAIGEGNMSHHERLLGERLRREDLLLVMQTLKSMRPESSSWVMSLLPPKQEFHESWSALGYERAVHITGSALREDALRAARAPLSKGIFLYSSAQGVKEYEDAPLFSADRAVRNLLAKYETHVNVVVDIHTFTSAKYLLPQHPDKTWLKKGEEDFQSTLAFMMGKAISADMFQTVLVHSFYNPMVIKFFNQLLHIPPETFDDSHPQFEATATKARALAAYAAQRKVIRENSTRVGSMYNDRLKFATFRDAMKALMKRLKVICIGVFRVLPEHEKVVGTPRYFITNPASTMPLLESDMIYFIR